MISGQEREVDHGIFSDAEIFPVEIFHFAPFVTMEFLSADLFSKKVVSEFV